ncbi:MAG: murein transglycosylase A [Coxiellaceae bacterium]|nr:murein transglycosylase A [Coxiellaceae bacterium]MDP1952094.1 murein transglycosylase A [Nitrosomonas sp.]
MKIQSTFSLFALVLLLNACSVEKMTSPVATDKPAESITPPPAKQSSAASPENPILKANEWSALTGWADDDIRPAWDAFLHSCIVLIKQPLWEETCSAAISVKKLDNATLRHFFETYFVPHQVLNADESDEGLVTGYYEPLLQGSRQPSKRYRYPLHTAPDGLLIIDLGEIYPELKVTRGRLEGRKIIPYYTRAEIRNNPEILRSHEFLWVEDKVELFFLQIQGSGRVVLENGEILKIGYAEHNGHPYSSIGKLLVERGELLLEKASMQGIKQWGQENPDKLDDLLHQNSRYIFFRELSPDLSGPVGSLGVPLTAGRSIAIDPRAVPQGAPVFLATTWPNTDKQLQRLMVAQDTGSAIKGNVRVDFFWGFGLEAANQAGKMKQKGKIWVLMPNGHTQSIVAQQ